MIKIYKKKYLKKIIDKISKDVEKMSKEFDKLSKTLNIDTSISLNVRLNELNMTSHFLNMLITFNNETYDQLEKYYLKEED